MFFAKEIRERCVVALRNVTDEKKLSNPNIYYAKDSTLLMAFATYIVIQKHGYDQLESEKDSLGLAYYQYYASDPTLNAGFMDVFGRFDSFSQFVHYVVPSLVADPEALAAFGPKHNIPGRQLAHHIITINKLLVNRRKDATALRHLTGKLLQDKLYSFYCSSNDGKTYPILSREEFFKFYRAILCYSLNPSELSLPRMFNKKGDCIAPILSDVLRHSRETQLTIVRDFFHNNNLSYEEFCQRYHSKFPNTPQKEQFNQLKHGILSNSPLNIMCVLYLHKQTSPRKSRSEHPHSYTHSNDIMLENGLVFRVFCSHLSPFPETEPEHIILMFPSPFFVKKWAEDETSRLRNTTFVLRTTVEKELLEFHFHNNSYANYERKHWRFLSEEEFTKENADDLIHTQVLRQDGQKNKVLFFGCAISGDLRDIWYQRLMQEATAPTDLYTLLASHEVELADESESLKFLSDSTRSILLIPQGIRNSTFPRRKQLLYCIIGAAPAQSTTLQIMTINTDDNQIACLEKCPDPPVVLRQPLTTLESTFRQKYQEEIMERRPAGRKNIMAFDYAFTPDITIWCSKTYPTKQVPGDDSKSRPRLEAYICDAKEPTKRRASSGRDRGRMILESRKHVTTKETRDIFHWLERTYPYSEVKGRISRQARESAGEGVMPERTVTDIHTVIANHYRQRLAGQNLALKTLWYIYPALSEKYNRRDYDVFAEMVRCTSIGLLTVDDTELDRYESELEQSYPDDTRDRLLYRLALISAALDFAKAQKHCEENVVAAIIKDGSKSHTRFRQVRSALMKRSFNLSELLAVYSWVMAKIRQGELEYIGVLLRLFTGLESNILCALTWKDFVYIEDYGFYLLRIYKQLTNDGMQVEGFVDLGDYRNIPCMRILSKALTDIQDKQLQHLQQRIAGVHIVSGIHHGTEHALITPNMLDKMCREALKAANIPDDIIYVPDNLQGTTETNLSKYHGDFFRNNFAHWLRTRAKFIPDEVQYWLGNTAATTFGHFYNDFLADMSQYMMYVKLRRWERLLLASDRPPHAVRYVCTPGKNQLRLTVGGTYSTQLIVHVIKKGPASSVEIEAETDYGMTTTIAFLEEHEEHE